ncbi:hypothetical protein AX16_005022 [Volvariella volvacea WC 439]|nr:hypothetical protein AX16_005022 [Volvariella volvacea WC 439]
MRLPIWLLLPILVVLWAAKKAWTLRSAFNQVRGYPAQKLIWFHPFRTLVLVFGGNLPRGTLGSWYTKFSLYAKYGSTCISSIHFWTGTPVYWFSDAEAIKVMGQQREIFVKDVEVYEALRTFGQNTITSEGAIWKRHRAVVKPAFNEKNNAFLWTETIHIVNQWFDYLNRNRAANAGKEAFQLDVNEEFPKITLMTIAAAGFGRRIAYDQISDKKSQEATFVHKLSFREAVTGSVRSLPVLAMAPEWLYPVARAVRIPFFSPLLQGATDCFDGMRLHMLELISVARTWVAGGRTSQLDAALLANLVEANMAQEGNKTLSDEELLSDVFAFLLAGHETTAHALCFAVLLLALHPRAQERIYEEACRLWPNGVPTSSAATPYKESMAVLTYTTAAFSESLRLCPTVARVAKVVDQDTSMKAYRFTMTGKGDVGNLQPFDVHLQKNSVVVFDITAVHHNPMYWGEDVDEFKPERFIDTDTYHWPRDAFVAFSTGFRGCIGQRFAMTEGVCILACLLRHYELLLPETVRDLPYAERRERVLKWVPGMTSTPVNPIVLFRPRTSKTPSS